MGERANRRPLLLAHSPIRRFLLICAPSPSHLYAILLRPAFFQWHQQGKNTEAHQLLSAVYYWFTEGFDTKDLQEAKALLDTLL
jgi:hypothetical protein